MIIRTFLLCLLLLIQASAEPLRSVTTDPDGDGPLPAARRVEGRVVLQFHKTLSSSELLLWGGVYGLSPRWTSEHGARHGLALVNVEESRLAGVLQVLSQDPLLKTVTPDYLVENHGFQQVANLSEPGATPTASFPNDPRFKEQWHLRMMLAPKAWKKATGKGVVIALLDTGIAYRDKGDVRAVEDLARTKFVEGYDFVNKDPVAVDDNAYGTHMAGILAQSTNNKIGVAGMAYQATLMPVKVLDENGSGSFSAIADGIRFAADQGARILVMGFGSQHDHLLMEDAVEYASSKGCLLVGSASASGGETPGYPAGYEQVLAVGAVAIDRSVTRYSSRGVDLVGPGGYLATGEGILQNTIHQHNPKRNGYLWFAGTNCAAANVAGVAALVMSCGVTDPDEIRDILATTALKKRDKKAYGAGIVNAQKAVKMALAKRSVGQSEGRGISGWLFLAGLLALLGVGLLGRRLSA